MHKERYERCIFAEEKSSYFILKKRMTGCSRMKGGKYRKTDRRLNEYKKTVEVLQKIDLIPCS